MEAVEMEDWKSTGLHFTLNNGSTFCKLDRFLVNLEWADKFDEALVEFQTPGISDHSPIIINLLSNGRKTKRPFGFKNIWADDEHFMKKIVTEEWLKPDKGCAMFQVKEKLKRLKKRFRELNALNYAHLREKAEEKRATLDKAQQEVHNNIGNNDLKQKERCALQDYINTERLLLSQLQQHAKVRRLADNDECTRYFFNCMKQRRKSNMIPALLNEQNVRLTGKEEIENHVLSYIEEQLGKEHSIQDLAEDEILLNGETISPEQNSNLTATVTAKEIKSALFSIGNDKSPGPDGFSAYFFKRSWIITGNLIIRAMRNFFDNGKILKEINATAIILTPKTDNPNLISEFRPIALCNVMYKILAKIIAEGLRKILSEIISCNQSAFIQDRQIADNILLAQELMFSYSRKNKSARCMINAELHQAFDSLNWSFLKKVLEALKMDEKMINWIMSYISTVSYSICINGELKGFFAAKQGLRQGDPLSPYLFIFAMDFLSKKHEGTGKN